MLRAIACWAAWSYTAPFGAPVVPLVQTMQVGSDGSSLGKRAGGSAANASLSSETGSTAPASAASGTASPSPRTVSAGVVRAKMLVRSATPSRGLMADAIAPTRSIPA